LHRVAIITWESFFCQISGKDERRNWPGGS
jgi:hypothetical protein